MPDLDTEASSRFARAALIALGATLESELRASPEAVRFLVLPSLAPLSLDEATVRLRDLPTPRRVYSFARLGMVVVGSFEDLPSYDSSGRLSAVLKLVGGERDGGDENGDLSAANFVVRWGPHEIVFGANEFELWGDLYRLLFVDQRFARESRPGFALLRAIYSLPTGGSINGLDFRS